MLGSVPTLQQILQVPDENPGRSKSPLIHLHSKEEEGILTKYLVNLLLYGALMKG